MKKTKKVNIKQIAKNEVKASIMEVFSDYEVIDCEEVAIDGFTKDTLIIRGYLSKESTEPVDIQVKLIAPKFGINQYDLDEED